MTADHRDLALAPGFRFFPTDEELMRDYLIRKCAGQPVASTVIAEVDLYRFDPWQLPDMASYGEKEWYFFTPRDRKYPNGKRPNRSAGTGYWKATGADRPIGLPNPIGIKKSLVFYAGKAPTGIKTNWIMHEYRLANVDLSAARNRNRLRLDDWVLCRVYNKKGNIETYPMTQPEASPARGAEGDRSPEVSLSIGLWLNPPPSESHTMETSDSVPILHPESSGSEPTNESDPKLKADEKEVQSEPKAEDDDFGKELEKAIDFSMVGYLGEPDLFGTRPRLQTTNHFSPLRLQDMFVFSQPKTQQADQKRKTQQKPS